MTETRFGRLERAAAERILIIDGAMGTMIQAHELGEAAFRGDRLANHAHDLRGNNDILNLTNRGIIRGIHDAFFAAGVDIIETNTFNATSISQADYHTEALAYDINFAGASIAREAADAATGRDPSHPRLVAGAIGPTNKTASMSPDVNNPGYRAVNFDALVASYTEAIRGLLDGGVDLLLIETIFDTLNAKAALFAIDALAEQRGSTVPLMISGTITDLSGRTLSGQTTEAFMISVAHARPWSIGLNCAFGAKELRPYVADLARIAGTRVSAYPNAGLPNEFGAYDETPDSMATQLGEWARAGLLNLVGGCCGTTPEHIKAISDSVAGVKPRPIPTPPKALRLAGLEPFVLAQ